MAVTEGPGGLSRRWRVWRVMGCLGAVLLLIVVAAVLYQPSYLPVDPVDLSPEPVETHAVVWDTPAPSPTPELAATAPATWVPLPTRPLESTAVTVATVAQATATLPLPDPLAALEDAVQYMEQGLDLLAAPTAAVVGRPFTVDYVVLRRSEAAPEGVATAIRSLGAGVTPVAGEVTVYPVMNAELVADARDFEVLAVTGAEQVFAGMDRLTWQWRLTPRRPGRLAFTVKVSAVIETTAGSKHRDAVKSQDVWVEARATPLPAWWLGVLGLALVGLLLGRLRWVRRRRPAGPRGLTAAAIAELVDLIAPLMDTEAERRTWLFQAFGDSPLRERIRLAGSATDFSAHLVESLWEHGALPDGSPALRTLLIALRSQVGGERQGRIDALVSTLWPLEADSR